MSKKHMISALFGGIAGLFGLAATALADAPVVEKTMMHNGIERSYILSDSNPAARRKRPLVLVLHGGGRADGADMQKRLGWPEMGAREGFVAVFPNGVDAQWNDGRGVSFRKNRDNAHVDDVGYISALIDRLVADGAIDPKRVYVTGASNGGMMSFRLACELSGKLAAVAPMIANVPEKIAPGCAPEKPLPLLLMNGTDDPLVPFDGGPVRVLGREYGNVISTDRTIALWLDNNGCGAGRATTRLPDRDTSDSSTVTVHRFSPCRAGSEVVLYEIIGGGHTLPGGDVPDRPRLMGHKNNDIDAVTEIWNFFKRHGG